MLTNLHFFNVFLSIIFGADVQKISTWLDDVNYEKYDVTYLALVSLFFFWIFWFYT